MNEAVITEEQYAILKINIVKKYAKVLDAYSKEEVANVFEYRDLVKKAEAVFKDLNKDTKDLIHNYTTSDSMDDADTTKYKKLLANEHLMLNAIFESIVDPIELDIVMSSHHKSVYDYMLSLKDSVHELEFEDFLAMCIKYVELDQNKIDNVELPTIE